MLNSFDESHIVNVNSIDNKMFEDVFFFTSDFNNNTIANVDADNDIDFAIPGGDIEDIHIKHNANQTSNDNDNCPSTNCSLLELKRKKNREASRISRRKKNEDIINLIKTNALLKHKIASLTTQLKDNICFHCKMSINKAPREEEQTQQIKGLTITSTSSQSSTPKSLFNTLPNRAKTAMFISMVVLFCVMVNSFNDKGKNYLRKVSIKHYLNDYVDSIEFVNDNYLNEMTITKCFDFVQYYNNMNTMSEYIKVFSVNQGSDKKAFDCPTVYVEANRENKGNDNENVHLPIQLRLNANKHYLMSQVLKDDASTSMSSSNSNFPTNYIELACIDIHLNPVK